MSQTSFYRWFDRFSHGHEQVEDEHRSGGPKIARNEKNIQSVEKLVMQSRRLLVRMISEVVGVSVGTVDTIGRGFKAPQNLCQWSSRRTRDSSVWNAAQTCSQ